MLSGLAGALSTYFSARDAEKQHREDQAKIAQLQASIDAANASLREILVTLKQPQLKHTTPILSWEPSTTAGVVGYNIYRSRTSGGPYVKLNGAPLTTLVYEDKSATPGSTYYYVSTAIDTRGMESPFSNERQVVIPAR
jgi:fibronectin type 3 domain-containing protein